MQGVPRVFDDTFFEIELLGQLVNRERDAERLTATIKADIAVTEVNVAAFNTPTVYYEIDATPYSVGPESFIGVIISKAGGKNIVSAELGDFPQLDPEYIVAGNPDIIMLGDAAYGESLETVSARPGWDAISAVQTGQVVGLTSEQVDIINRPGPRLAQAVRIVAQFLHGDKF